MAKKCKECGKEFKDKGKICSQCLDAMRHNLTMEELLHDSENLKPAPEIPIAVPPASVREVPIDEVQGNIMAHMLCERIEKPEAVNHPLHYGGDTTYECIKVLKAWMSADEYRGFLRGNAIKYLCRTGKKDETVQELKKSAWYINKLIESYEA